MPSPQHRREVGRGERVRPGVWRLRLPLPLPGVPHCNAWAVAAGDGVILFDCGLHEPGSLAHLERAMGMVGLRLDLVRLLVCTHAHIDHYGQAATVLERAGCELWMHPNHAHATRAASDPAASLERAIEIGRQSGVPEEPLSRWAEQRSDPGYGLAGVVNPDRPLVDGVTVASDLGDWEAIETPGHAPSHVCLYQPENRILISGDHVLGRVSLYFDFGYTRDPVGQYRDSLDRVEGLGARLGLSGHGRTFGDVGGHIAAARAAVDQRVTAALDVVNVDGPLTAYDAVPRIFGESLPPPLVQWRLTETLCYLRHLEVAGRIERIPGEDSGPERWVAR